MILLSLDGLTHNIGIISLLGPDITRTIKRQNNRKNLRYLKTAVTISGYKPKYVHSYIHIRCHTATKYTRMSIPAYA